MTAIYRPLGEEPSELCHPIDEDDFETIVVLCDGTPRRATWKPLAVELIHEDRGRQLLPSDSPWLGSNSLIFRPSAVDALGHLLDAYGELLPLACSEADLFLYNVTRVIDALDQRASTIHRFDDGGLWIKRYVFRPGAIDGVDVFKIPDLRASPTFVSHRFVDRWLDAGLRGLEFTPVWLPN